MKITVAFFLFLLVFSNRVWGQAKPGPLPATETAPGQTIKLRNDISDEFREIAGDAFDTVQALNESKRKGLLFYEPALHEAELAIAKANRKANKPDEKNLADFLDVLKFDIVLYRNELELRDLCKESIKVLINCSQEEYQIWAEEHERQFAKDAERIAELLKKPVS